MNPKDFSRRHLIGAAGAAAGLAALPACAVGKSDRLKITRIDMFRVAVPMQDDIIYSPEYVETP
ncbi:MAG: twin-arginine translocation signal domain-containing protein, partial [Acidobacteriia bacterium]|nr:twin-arginine translocation signal domain-containing protein [Terriglobia bacterium]